jgi:hypothetical protein
MSIVQCIRPRAQYFSTSLNPPRHLSSSYYLTAFTNSYGTPTTMETETATPNHATESEDEPTNAVYTRVFLRDFALRKFPFSIRNLPHPDSIEYQVQLSYPHDQHGQIAIRIGTIIISGVHMVVLVACQSSTPVSRQQRLQETTDHCVMVLHTSYPESSSTALVICWDLTLASSASPFPSYPPRLRLLPHPRNHTRTCS